jgi:RNA polymerase sigma factor (sigma-70 family)
MLGEFRNRIAKGSVASFHDSAADEQLVAAAKRGDELAFESLFRRYQRRIFALAFRYMRVREDAEDIVQQTFYNAFIHLHQFEWRSSFSTWATRIAINQALMMLRKRRALHEVPIDDLNNDEGRTSVLEPVDASPDPEANYLQGEKARILSSAMRRLRPGTRRAFELKELGELSARETAGHMGVSVATIKTRVFRARRELSKALRAPTRSRRLSKKDISVLAHDAGPMSLVRLSCVRN